MTTEERFWNKVRKTEGCWEWNGARAGGGYGLFSVNGKLTLAHRYIYAIHYGEVIISQKCVLHKCDNPPCVNPEHLFLGTRKDNMQDAILKNRIGNLGKHGNHAKGVNNGSAKLIESQVQDIRQKYAQGNMTLRCLAIEYNINKSLVSLIIRRKRWKHI